MKAAARPAPPVPPPVGWDEIENYAGRPIARISKQTHEVVQVNGECCSSSCKRAGWLKVHVKGTDWACDEECQASHKAQIAAARAAQRRVGK